MWQWKDPGNVNETYSSLSADGRTPGCAHHCGPPVSFIPLGRTTMLRAVTVADLPEIDSLIERSVLQTLEAPAIDKAHYLQRIRQNLAWWKDNPDLAVHLQFSSDATPVGVILVKNFWNLCHLFVDPFRQRTGIGSALVQAAIEQCRGRTSRPAVRVNSSRNAIPFYRSKGFVVVHEAPPPYTGLQFEYPFSHVTELRSAP